MSSSHHFSRAHNQPAQNSSATRCYPTEVKPLLEQPVSSLNPLSGLSALQGYSFPQQHGVAFGEGIGGLEEHSAVLLSHANHSPIHLGIDEKSNAAARRILSEKHLTPSSLMRRAGKADAALLALGTRQHSSTPYSSTPSRFGPTKPDRNSPDVKLNLPVQHQYIPIPDSEKSRAGTLRAYAGSRRTIPSFNQKKSVADTLEKLFRDIADLRMLESLPILRMITDELRDQIYLSRTESNETSTILNPELSTVDKQRWATALALISSALTKDNAQEARAYILEALQVSRAPGFDAPLTHLNFLAHFLDNELAGESYTTVAKQHVEEFLVLLTKICVNARRADSPILFQEGNFLVASILSVGEQLVFHDPKVALKIAIKVFHLLPCINHTTEAEAQQLLQYSIQTLISIADLAVRSKRSTKALAIRTALFHRFETQLSHDDKIRLDRIGLLAMAQTGSLREAEGPVEKTERRQTVVDIYRTGREILQRRGIELENKSIVLDELSVEAQRDVMKILNHMTSATWELHLWNASKRYSSAYFELSLRCQDSDAGTIWHACTQAASLWRTSSSTKRKGKKYQLVPNLAKADGLYQRGVVALEKMKGFPAQNALFKLLKTKLEISPYLSNRSIALNDAQQYCALSKQLKGEVSAEYADSLSILARVLIERKMFGPAEQRLLDTIKISAKEGGAQAVPGNAVLMSYWRLVKLSAEQELWGDAKGYLDDSEQYAKRTFGEVSHETLRARIDRAELLFEQMKASDGDPAADERILGLIRGIAPQLQIFAQDEDPPEEVDPIRTVEGSRLRIAKIQGELLEYRCRSSHSVEDAKSALKYLRAASRIADEHGLDGFELIEVRVAQLRAYILLATQIGEDSFIRKIQRCVTWIIQELESFGEQESNLYKNVIEESFEYLKDSDAAHSALVQQLQARLEKLEELDRQKPKDPGWDDGELPHSDGFGTDL